MDKDLQMRVRQCKVCEMSKPAQKTTLRLLASDQPSQIFSWNTWANFFALRMVS
jgi:hypothetical protein